MNQYDRSALKRGMEQTRMTVETLATAIGVTPRTVRRWLNGTQGMTRRHRDAIQEILGVYVGGTLYPGTPAYQDMERHRDYWEQKPVAQKRREWGVKAGVVFFAGVAAVFGFAAGYALAGGMLLFAALCGLYAAGMLAVVWELL